MVLGERSSGCCGDYLRVACLAIIFFRQFRGSQLDRQLVELAGEAERRLVVVVVHARAGIDSDIEGLVDGKATWNSVRDGFLGDFLAVHRQDARAAFRHAGPVVFEVKHDGVLARRQCLRSFPTEAFQTEEVVGEDRFALEQVQAIAPESPAEGVEHSFGTVRRNFHVSCNG